jgi:hypothetical protein
MKEYYTDRFCKCGCKGKIEKKSCHLLKGYKIPEYILGHHVRISNPMHDPKVVEKLSGQNSAMKRVEVKNKIKEKNNPFYGKKHSKEVKEYLKQINSGEFNPMYGKEGFWKNKKRSQEWITRVREWAIKRGFKGEKNPMWKGGIQCDPYCSIWLDKEYKDSIKERDEYKCLNPVCKKISNKICIHHIDYNKKNCNPFNLITLCFSCNGTANKDREWHQQWYQTIIYRRYIMNR